jgi:hypothetical protein
VHFACGTGGSNRLMDNFRPVTAGLKDAGKALWTDAVAEIDFPTHELKILAEAAKTLDAVQSLQNSLDHDAPIVESELDAVAGIAVDDVVLDRRVLDPVAVDAVLAVVVDEVPGDREVRDHAGEPFARVPVHVQRLTNRSHTRRSRVADSLGNGLVRTH